MIENENINVPEIGMTWKNPSMLKPNEYGLMVNGGIFSFNNTSFQVTNEPSNLLTSRLKGFKVVGTNLVAALGMTFYFLTNPETGESEIGYIYDQSNLDSEDRTSYCSECNTPLVEDTPLENKTPTETTNYYTFINASCLNFNINYPVQSWIKVDDCRIRIYFTDDLNPPRYIDYNDFNQKLQNKNLLNCPILHSDELDCDKINVFPVTCYPKIAITDIVSGGQNQAGTYQFAICYADVRGNKVTDYFHVTNPVPLFTQEITVPTDYPVAKSIKLEISNLNTDFQYINIVVLKTINTVTSANLVETIQFSSSSLNYLYTGIQANIAQNLSFDEVLTKRPLYIAAKGLSESNGYMMLYDLKQPRVLNLQSEMIDLPVYWQTVSLREGAYKNSEIAANFVGYLGDEVYGFGISFTRKNATDTAVFHIAGREATDYDWENVSCINASGNPDICLPNGKNKNKDVLLDSTCSTDIPAFRWQVYNTGSLIGSSIGYDQTPVELTAIKTCTSPEFEITPSGEYKDKNGNIIPNTDSSWQSFCSGCQSAIESQYLNIPGITLSPGGITNITTAPTGINDPNISILTPSGYVTFYDYPDTVTVPSIGQFPYSYSPCISNPSGTPQGFIDVKTNATQYSALNVFPSPNSQCSLDPGFPFAPQYGTFLNNIPTQTNTSHNNLGVDDLNRSWYAFTVTSNTTPIAIMIQTNNSPLIEIFDNCILTNPSAIPYDPANPCSPVSTSLEPNVYLNKPAGTQFVNQNYVVLNPKAFVLGNTYYIKVYSTVKQPFSPVDVQKCYFRICLLTPIKQNPRTEYTNTIATIDCKYQVKYTTTITPNNACSVPNYQFGRMAYWESTELYPCNIELYGKLAGKPIRHHKFPDETVSLFFEGLNPTSKDSITTYKSQIHPKGIMISVKDIKERLYNAYFKGLITNEELNSICGYRIWRSDRRGNESIVAKGLLYDVWEYTDNAFDTGNKILFSNFPYNDNHPNKFLSENKLKNKSSIRNIPYVKHPNNDFFNTKYTFDAPNLLFNNPGLGTELKLESELFGISTGSYQDVKNNCVYQYIGPGIITASIGFSSIQAGFQALQVMASATLTMAITVFGSGTDVPLGLILALVGANVSAPTWVMTYYADWFDIISKFAPFNNYAIYYCSIGYYDRNQSTPNLGNKRRSIVSTQYLKPGILNVSTLEGNARFNNYQRESTCFVEVNDYLPKTINLDNSRWLPANDGINSKITNICSYYASMKNNLLNQYGNLESIKYLDTGFNGVIDWSNERQETVNQTIFGGDTYINRFALKRKVPMFLDDRVPTSTTNITAAENQDLVLSAIPNIAYPVYFMDYPTGYDYSGPISIFGSVAVQNDSRLDFNLLNKTSTGNAWRDFGFASGIVGAVAGAFFGVLSLTIFVSAALGTIDADLGSDMFILGKYIHSVYGIPYFLCESNYNLDYRHGENMTNKDFFPHVADTISWTQQSLVPINEDNYYFYNSTYSKPNRENFAYVLNQDFNQQIEDCKVHNQDRVIYSLQDLDQNDRYDGNLIFQANNYFDFPKSAGKITILKGIENNKVLVVQENQASLFNSYVQLQTNIGSTAVGSNALFSQSPAQYIKTDLGFAGSQTTAFVSTEFGHYWVDNKRGQVINLSQSVQDVVKPEDSWWFKQNLPFNILKDFPDVDINNNYKWFGMALTYDAKFKRLFITKRDAQILPEYKKRVSFVNGQFVLDAVKPEISSYVFTTGTTISPDFLNQLFTANNGAVGTILSISGNTITLSLSYGDALGISQITFKTVSGNVSFKVEYKPNIESGTVIIPTDPVYFCNKSWTISYSPLTKTFVSFHSFTPNYYTSNQNYFSSGINYSTTQDITESGVWCHLLTQKSYQVYYGKIYPFIIDYSIPSKYANKVFCSLEYKCEFRRFIDGNNNYYSNPNVTYDKAVIYTSSICSGDIELIVKQKDNLFQSTQYPKIVKDASQILIENIEDFWRTNGQGGISDISLKNGQPVMNYTCSIPYTVVNKNSISYAPKFISLPLRSDYFCIRLENYSKSNYSIYHRFSLTEDSTSPS
jgi:hypothetical protein